MKLNQQIDAINKELHPAAKELTTQYVNDFATSLLLHAKILAHQNKDELVLKNRIEEAKGIINKRRDLDWHKELIIVVGGAFFGTFVQGFISELTTGSKLLVAIYTLIGIVGMFLVFYGLRR